MASRRAAARALFEGQPGATIDTVAAEVGVEPKLIRAWKAGSCATVSAVAVESPHLLNAKQAVDVDIVNRVFTSQVSHLQTLTGTALHAAAWMGRVSDVELLLQHGANPNAHAIWSPAQDQGKTTPTRAADLVMQAVKSRGLSYADAKRVLGLLGDAA